MGIGATGLQFALLGRRRGVKFTRTLMIGRQHHFVDAWWVQHLFGRFGIEIGELALQRAVAQPYAEGLFQALGAEVADSMDASTYESATLIHNLNKPVPERFKRQYTCVVEYGTLEHVFNFPVAIKSIMDMIKVGGHLLTITPANNLCGHGFYQFSPELYFNLLSRNGFEDIEVYLMPYRWTTQIFRVAGPREVRGRVELCNSEPMQLGVIAKKRQHVEEIVMPIQSDYEDAFWKGRDINRGTAPGAVVDPQLAAAIGEFRQRVAALVSWPESISPQLTAGLENGLHYQSLDPAVD